MADYKLTWKASTYTATVRLAAAATPGDEISAGTFTHVVPAAQKDKLGSGDSHVFYNHVQDLLYKQGVEDMARVKIRLRISEKPVTALTLSDNTLTIPSMGKEQLGVTFTPADATDKRLAFTTSNPDVALVSQEGHITYVAPGTADIIVQSVDSDVTKVCVVTCT